MMTYVFRCPQCHGAPTSLDHSDLRPVREELLGAEWQCSRCKGWARVRVDGPDYELTVEKGAAPAVRT